MKIKRALKVWQRNFKVYTKLYRSSFALNFFDPLIYLIALGFGLGGYVREIEGVPYIKFIASGIIATSAIFAAIYECTYGTYVRMNFQKTFEGILATPVNIKELTLGEILWGSTKSLIYGFTIIIVIFLFGLVDSPSILLALPFVFLSGFLFSQLSIIIVTIIPGIESFNYFYTLVITPLFLFSGVFFPLKGLPEFIEIIAFFNPFYHSVNICRGFALGNTTFLWKDGLWLIIASLILFPLPFKLMRKKIIP